MDAKTKEILDFAEQLIGEKLSKNLSESLTHLGEVYRTGRRNLRPYELQAYYGLPVYNYHNEIILYPEIDPPKNAHEFLSCVKYVFNSTARPYDSELQQFFKIMPLTQKHILIKKQLDIDNWTNALIIASESPTAEANSPRIRLRVLTNTIILEISFSEDQPFRKLAVSKMRDLENDDVKWYDLATKTIFDQFINKSSYGYASYYNELNLAEPRLISLLATMLREPSSISTHLVYNDESPVILHTSPLHWQAKDDALDASVAQFGLYTENNTPLNSFLLLIPGQPNHLLTNSGIYPVLSWPDPLNCQHLPLIIPKAALHTSAGVSFYKKIGIPLPKDLAKKVINRQTFIEVTCQVDLPEIGTTRALIMQANAYRIANKPTWYWNKERWIKVQGKPEFTKEIVEYDDSILAATGTWLKKLNFKPVYFHNTTNLELRITKNFPDIFLEWINSAPNEVKIILDNELTDLVNGVVSGKVTLDIEQSSSDIDWFDIHVDVSLTDTTLSKEEIDLLLKAKGKWVMLQDKGWRKLEYNFSEETLQELADIGLSINDFKGDKQKLHALQLGSLAKKKSSLLNNNAVEQISRRIEEIQTRVTPPIPSSISATLRPYQEEGFHFLAYLTTNQFGGVLADDMGLGKTLQALTWLAWLHESRKNSPPSLVIAPKSVQENWSSEAARFYPKLRTRTWKPGDIDDQLDPTTFDLLIINYAQLRTRSPLLNSIAWLAVIVDEAQNIKNPSSQSTQCVRALNAIQRLALTGTPIENRLMDLWSIFSFAMPGALGTRASFTRNYDKATDTLARRRLSARTRPFLLRRTKNEVAKDLPDRIEEDLFMDLEGTQKTLYNAELKRARAHLLNATLPGKLDSLRFNLLSSLLRLRQICCHPALIGLETEELVGDEKPVKSSKKITKKPTAKKIDASQSAKLEALLELLEPLIEQGQKVLVFSQFVTMLEIIQIELEKRAWKNYILTGKTNERGALVKDFQSYEGSAVFLISLKAGGSGLNLTAASYVVLFDPWWNPAVEAQAIDRTHRIGQKSTVIAYRLVVKDTIEQKIRSLQKHKSAVANDILGEENFAKALTISDFQFLLADS